MSLFASCVATGMLRARTPRVATSVSTRCLHSSGYVERTQQVTANRAMLLSKDVVSVCGLIWDHGGPNNLNLFNLVTGLHRLSKLPGEGKGVAETAEEIIHVLTQRLRGTVVDPEPLRGEVSFGWLSRSAWAAEKLCSRGLSQGVREKSFDLLREIAKVLPSRLFEISHASAWTPRDVANLVTTLSAFGHTFRDVQHNQALCEVTEFFDVAARCVLLLHRRGELHQTDCAKMIWAFAVIPHTSTRVFDALVDGVSARGWRSVEPRDLSAVAWGLTVVGAVEHPALQEIAACAVLAVPRFDTQGMTNMCWAMARAGSVDTKKLFAVVGAHISDQVPRGVYTGRQLSNISWAFATAACVDEVLVDAIAQQSSTRFEELQVAEASALLWSFASLGQAESNSISAFAVCMESACTFSLRDFRGWDAQSIANTLWSLAVLGRRNAKAVESGAEVLARMPNTLEMHRVQWYLAWLAHTKEPVSDCFGPKATAPRVDPDWMKRCEVTACDLAISQYGTRSSLRHERIAGELRKEFGRQMRISCEYAVRGCLVVDIALPDHGVVLEVDGPSHFVHVLRARSGGQQPADFILNGATVYKHRLLRSDGWRVLSLPFYDWGPLAESKRRRALLRSLLARNIVVESQQLADRSLRRRT
eukprot:TRINITY_DN54656_c0_g1_i1.p1 TRINITY_DN54656_c0_g1~~TRINITY_DN54656_c0_g1_i1.p1  ORF type:complete len:665 (-),score=84.27 TRINITY_DN54656_c0_g1_i1:505-2442(-)